MNTLVLWILLTTSVQVTEDDLNVNAKWVAFTTEAACIKERDAYRKKGDDYRAECGTLTYIKGTK
jgi:hypothetical protein